MKMKKVLAVLSAAALSASLLSAFAVTGSAEEIAGLPKYAPITLDGSVNLVQVDLAAFEGVVDANIASIDFTIKPSTGNWGEGWFGGGFGIGIQAGDTWTQIDCAGDGTDEISIGWAEVAEGGSVDTPYSFTFELPEGTETPFLILDEDVESETYGQMINAGPIQFGYWWGSNPSIDITEFTINFDDGSSIALIDEAATEVYVQAEYTAAMNKVAREKVAADALAALQAEIGKLTVSDTIADMNAAAEALTNAKDILAQADAAAEEIDALADELAAAQAAFDALQDGDVADTEAFAAAKAAVEKVSADLDAAKKALNDAIAAYDAATAEQLNKKDQEIADLKAQLEEALAQNETDAATIKDLQDQIAALEAEKAELEAQLEEALQNQGTTPEEPTTEEPATEEPATDKDEVPATGVAVALGGVALAAAAVVATKKRK